MRFMVKKILPIDQVLRIIDTDEKVFMHIDYTDYDDKLKAFDFAEKLVKVMNKHADELE